MTPGADCAGRWPLISALADGETTPVETAAATAHLARCAACRDRIRRCADQLPGARWLPGAYEADPASGSAAGHGAELTEAVLARLDRAADRQRAVVGCVPGGAVVWAVGTATCGCPPSCGCGCQQGGACACRVAVA